MWAANNAALHAGRGHRRAAAKCANEAGRAVDDAQAELQRLNERARPQRQVYETLAAEARNLEQIAAAGDYASQLWSQLTHDRLDDLTAQLNAFEVWRTWAGGELLSVHALVDAAERLAVDVERSRDWLFRPDDLTGREYLGLLNPLAEWLERQGIDLEPRAVTRDLGIDRGGPDLGIDL
jgi:hypothetical protein